MNSNQKQFNILKKILDVSQAASVRFSNIKEKQFVSYLDTACTALARCLKNNKLTYIDRQFGQLCEGANHFLKIKACPRKNLCDVYIKKEAVFKNKSACLQFLKELTPYPRIAETKYIYLAPFTQERKKPDVIIMLANAAQVGKILGLSVYNEFEYPHILPAGPSCLALFAPLANTRIHLNFIDYYDRYYQGKQNGKYIFEDNEMLVSMTYATFSEIIMNIAHSPHGNYKPKLRPVRIERFSK